MLGGEHSGKVSKKFIGNFFFWGITLIDPIHFGIEGTATVKVSLFLFGGLIGVTLGALNNFALNPLPVYSWATGPGEEEHL